jgi:integrase
MSRRGENIRKRKDGRWEGRYTVYESGKNHVRSVYARSYAQAKEKLAKAKAIAISRTAFRTSAGMGEMCDSPSARAGDSLPLAAVAEEWLQAVRQSRKYSTYMKYLSVYEHHIKKPFGELPVSRIRSEPVADSIRPGISESLTKSIYSVLNQMLSYAARHLKTGEVHLKRTETPKKMTPVKILNPSEQTRLLRILCPNPRRRDLGILLSLFMGLRLGEVCSLKWEDFDMEAKILHVCRTVQRVPTADGKTRTVLMEGEPKTSCSKRDIPIPDFLYELLLPFSNDGVYLLDPRKPTDPRTCQNRFKACLRAAGIEDTHFHVLRHTFATNSIDHGADVKSVSEMLGHSDVKITLNRYVHPTIETKRGYMNRLASFYGHFMGQAS